MSAQEPGETQRRLKPVCPCCGSDDVSADAAVRWDVDAQCWEVSNVFDKDRSCDDCGERGLTFDWVDS